MEGLGSERDRRRKAKMKVGRGGWRRRVKEYLNFRKK
jgi:hypothetical protein